jgi:hypothetical protein
MNSPKVEDPVLVKELARFVEPVQISDSKKLSVAAMTRVQVSPWKEL